ncbi:hypothetical protein LT85_1389 [Collimonas arenae]|uniref:Methyltransferase domain-containing protein n=1 Tax=Collimonas arenae TaxID=279058 RepID=A0A0A1FCG5_9BURK|nr:class I SAM-dependent methyltransferase [Collimonas arenae]AIY40547.1 hypothetical protein LT85_1389 [Collimonas arenae]
MSKNMPSYLLNVGAADQERLNILANLYNPGSQTFLRAQAAVQALDVLDIGCGHGHMAFWLAQQLQSRGGKVLGIDTSDAQLNICQEKKEKAVVANVQFLHHDMGVTPLELQSFDVAYCRFLLMHVKEWSPFFHNVLASCRRGGSMIIEEPVFPFFCYPEHESVKRASALFTSLSAATGFHYDCSARLWQYAQLLDVEVAGVAFNQPALITPQEKSLLWRTFEQIKQPVLAAKLATESELNDITTDLETLAHDPHCLIGGLRVMQLNLRKC